MAPGDVLAAVGAPPCREGLPNKEMQQTKPAFCLEFAGFAADLQCWTDFT